MEAEQPKPANHQIYLISLKDIGAAFLFAYQTLQDQISQALVYSKTLISRNISNQKNAIQTI